MKVLSQIESTLRFLAVSAMRPRSMSLSIGLVGDSTHTIFVFGVMAASKVSGRERSTNEKLRPWRLNTLSKSRNVPP